ncbi:EscE/YscE/SsaE family type III secretion system needle protein co-chaperone [Paracoccus kondratievae]|uniref:EscE/YscE/SsaE family type III secretion system needle protein co-chaperone n=1 Tax=Paracoccus kondratievae TaxID=135740 RepID=UPI001D0D75A5|nr:EscE/YscE/SsaE family type III secretion system needle protein co-chaperone [Paracoccus kondratievae]
MPRHDFASILKLHGDVKYFQFREGGRALSDRALELDELERLLNHDPAGVELKRLLEKLSAAKSIVIREMDRGVSPEVYAQLTLLAQAYNSGIDALPKLWANINHSE